MIKFTDYDIVFQEIPDHVTLAINLSGCPNRCVGCHTPELMADIGQELTEAVLDELMARYRAAITCVCFMGGDGDPERIEQLARWVRSKGVAVGWYSGKPTLPERFGIDSLDYLKLGPYVQALGGLTSPRTNQRFYRIEHRKLIDVTSLFVR